MPVEGLQYLEDLTGTSPSNRIINEPIVNAAQVSMPNRILVPRHGPFFSTNCQVVSTNNGFDTILAETTDYIFIEPSSAAWLATGGKPVYHAILIKNQALPANFKVSYNTIGGLYHYDSSALSNTIESLTNQTGVNYETQLLNKPVVFPVANHTQPVDTIYGFGPLTVALERLGDAITLSNTPAYSRILEIVDEKMALGGGEGGTVTPIELTNAVNNHNASPTAHTTIRNAIAVLESSTAKIITEETTFHVKHTPGIGEFGSLQDAWNHLRNYYIREKVTIQVQAGNYSSGRLWLDGIKPTTENVSATTASYQSGEFDRNLIWIIGGNGVVSDQVTITHTPSKFHESFVSITDSNICFTGLTFVGAYNGIGYFNDSTSFNLSAPAYTAGVMDIHNSYIKIGGNSEHRNARKRYLSSDTAALSQSTETQLSLYRAMDPGLTLLNGVSGLTAVNSIVNGDCIEIRNYGSAGLISSTSNVYFDVIMTFGYRKTYDYTNVNNNHTFQYLGKSESYADKLARHVLQDTPDSTSDTVARIGIAIYGGLVSTRCLRSDNNSISVISADSGYFYLVASNRNGKFVDSKYGNTLPTLINSTWVAILTVNGGVAYLDTFDYALNYATSVSNINLINNPDQSILYTNPETSTTTSLATITAASGLVKNTIRVRPGGIMFYSNGGVIDVRGRFRLGVTYKFLRGDATGYATMQSSIAYAHGSSSEIRVYTHGVQAGYSDTSEIAVHIDNTDKLRRAESGFERYSTRTAKFKGVYKHIYGGLVRVGYYHGPEIADAFNCVGDKSAGELAFTSSGYSTAENGLVYQWGEFTTTGSPDVFNITFPIAFEKKVLLVEQLDLFNYVGEIAWIGDYNKTNTGFSIQVPYPTAVRTIRWLAIGV